ncbi:MAG: prepilin peptidase, partial [Parvularculaceae bacterium]|nr:prepilin peptidase [Parvularculaceae bacterium]
MNWVFPATAALAGLFVGSFLNVVAYRGVALWGLAGDPPSKARGDFIAPRSYCPSCKTQIAWSDLVPVFSFLLRRGRCRACAAPIPRAYPLVELAAGAGAAAAAVAYGATATAALA